MNHLRSLPDYCRERADFLRPYAPAAATAYEECAVMVEAALRAVEEEELTVREACARSGYSERTLREMVAAGKLENVGRKGAPRFRRGDLPSKPRGKGGTFDPQAFVHKASMKRRTG